MTAYPALFPGTEDTDDEAAAPSIDRATALESYLAWLREAIQVVLRVYREAWDAVGAQTSTELQAVVAIGLRLARPAPGLLKPLPAGLFDGVDLPVEAELMLAAAWWSAADPPLAVAFGCIHDDAARRYPTLGALRLMMEPYGLDIPLALPADTGLVADGLLCRAPDADTPIRLTATATLLLDGWRPAPEVRAPVPERLRGVTAQVVAHLRSGHRVTLRCNDADDGPVIARAAAAELERAAEIGASPARPATGAAPPSPVTPASLITHGPDRPIAETALLARLGLVLPVGDSEAEPVALRLTGPGAPAAPGWQVLNVPGIDPAGLLRAWRRTLRAAGFDPREAGPLAARIRISERMISALSQSATESAAAQQRDLTVADLHQAVRRHPQHQLDGMANLLTPSVTFDDLVLTGATRSGLQDLLAHARHFSEFSPPGAGTRGRAVAALFYGPSGTGKTAAAEAIAAELDRDLWIADLAQVVSKWLGETSHNLDRLLTEAARCGAVLLFDEAEGLFGRRAEVSDARDRYANLEIDHLLQRIELHEGLVILTSNRPSALDEGFQRRLRITVRFDPPGFEARQQLWNRFLTNDLMAPGASADVAAAADLSAASIRAAAVSARVFAAADGMTGAPCAGLISEDHVHRAVARELEKSGRVWAPPARTRNSQPHQTSQEGRR
ncbi:AAA family ATPase [Dactylosporangium sp. McL0621]|uniref:AAA family ATPase n=1 Tax=Dactylosporangium sp. McL0621 TaxID=3415678 RepID=UPI003CED01D1